VSQVFLLHNSETLFTSFPFRVAFFFKCIVSLVVCFCVFSSDYSKSNQKQRIRQHIKKTVFVGETVTLHCNKTLYDDDFTWKMNSSIIFSYDSTNNRTMRNFSSNRIHINPAVSKDFKIHQIQASDAGNYTCHPAAIRWTLTIIGYSMILFI